MLRLAGARIGFCVRPCVRTLSSVTRGWPGAFSSWEVERRLGKSVPGNAFPCPGRSQVMLMATSTEQMSDVRFDSLPISPESKRALDEVLSYEYCTKVQAATLQACLSGTDVVAKAKTGTGKTLGFLIPVVEQVVTSGAPRGHVTSLILSPTRELAMQIHKEATQLLAFHNIATQVVIGGTNVRTDVERFRRRCPDLFIATPGRLIDLMDSAGIGQQLKHLQVLVLDEGDRLLDMGFKMDIEKILRNLPAKTKRQTLLFSATFPKDVQRLASTALKQEYDIIDTVGEDTEETNIQVSQHYMVTPMTQQIPQLLSLLRAHREENPDYKVIVFFATARMTQFYAQLFNAMGVPCLEIHSRKSQGTRTNVAKKFRENNRVILFTSDVSARGVDYPDVSLVVQVGVPSDRAQYIHRLGRTGRAGKDGMGVLMLADYEKFFLRQVNDLPLEEMQPSTRDMEAIEDRVNQGIDRTDRKTGAQAYQAWLGFYKSCKGLRMSSEELVSTANKWAYHIGFDEPPALQSSTIGKMGLKGVPGLNIQRGRPGGTQFGGSGGGYRGGGGGRRRQRMGYNDQ